MLMIDLFSFLLKGGASNCSDVIWSASGEFVQISSSECVECSVRRCTLFLLFADVRVIIYVRKLQCSQ